MKVWEKECSTLSLSPWRMAAYKQQNLYARNNLSSLIEQCNHQNKQNRSIFHLMEPLLKVLESQAIVRFQDCDPYQHLNNSKYLDYMLNAREDQIALHYGLDVFKIAREKKIAWVVGQHQIAYLRPAFFMETVTIQSQLLTIADRSVQVEIRMYNEEKTVLYAVL